MLCLLTGYIQILPQTKGADSVNNSEIDRFCISPLQICDLIKRNMEYLGRRRAVNVLILPIRFDKLLISGQMR